jgi:hypothetical protein
MPELTDEEKEHLSMLKAAYAQAEWEALGSGGVDVVSLVPATAATTKALEELAIYKNSIGE